jgi:hypothetical protein
MFSFGLLVEVRICFAMTAASSLDSGSVSIEAVNAGEAECAGATRRPSEKRMDKDQQVSLGSEH